MKLANFAAVALSLVFSVALLGQWPNFPTPGAPKQADGRPDMTGPAPKTSDGKPNFSGVWNSGPGAGKGKGKGALPPGSIPPGGFLNMGVNMPGGLLPYQDVGLKLRTERLARNSADHPDAHCLPLHPIQLWFHPQPRKLIQTPLEIVMLAEANGGTRQIFTDGRSLPKAEDAQPWWYGYSVGHWEGDTLVVDSNGFLDDSWIDENGSPLSNQAHVTERIRRPNYGSLEIQITVNDPKMYKQLWSVTANQSLLADDELIEFVCGENNTSLQHYVTK